MNPINAQMVTAYWKDVFSGEYMDDFFERLACPKGQKNRPESAGSLDLGSQNAPGRVNSYRKK